MTNAGGRYEGCAYTGNGRYAQTWICDYRANWHTFYEGDFSYFKVFKDWGSVVVSQAQCAAAWGGWWRGDKLGTAAWTGMVRDCGATPYTPNYNQSVAPNDTGSLPGVESADGAMGETDILEDDPAVTVVENDPLDPSLPVNEQVGLPGEEVSLGSPGGPGMGVIVEGDPAVTVVENDPLDPALPAAEQVHLQGSWPEE